MQLLLLTLICCGPDQLDSKVNLSKRYRTSAKLQRQFQLQYFRNRELWNQLNMLGRQPLDTKLFSHEELMAAKQPTLWNQSWVEHQILQLRQEFLLPNCALRFEVLVFQLLLGNLENLPIPLTPAE